MEPLKNCQIVILSGDEGSTIWLLFMVPACRQAGVYAHHDRSYRFSEVPYLYSAFHILYSDHVLVSLIAAADENDVIGVNNQLPWKLPADMQRFQDLTSGHPVIMGRKTYESLPPKHRPLPERMNIVITRNAKKEMPGCTVVTSLSEALDAAKASHTDEVFVIGGGEVYEQALPEADRIYLTRVHGSFEGDTHFPPIEPKVWSEIEREEHTKDAKHAVDYTFFVYERR